MSQEEKSSRIWQSSGVCQTSRAWQVRQTELRVDLSSVKRNLQTIYRRNKKARVVAVLKSDAYGCGAIPLAKYLEQLPENVGLQGFGVANVEEGLEFRKEKLLSPIYILSGIQNPNEDLYQCLVTCKLIPVVTSVKVLKRLSDLAKSIQRPLDIHIKFDTGMHRLGVSPDSVEEALQIILGNPILNVEGFMSHYAAAEKSTSSSTKKQTKLFRKIIKFFGNHSVLPKYHHMSNSAGSQFNLYPEGNLVRAGIQLYGECAPDVRPIATWEAQVYDTKPVRRGEGIGYGPAFRAKRNMEIAILGVGYADGYRRALMNKAEVLIKGNRCKVVGAVSMDLVAVDVTGIRGINSNTKAVLLGKQGRNRIDTTELAKIAGCIPYEILTGISPRVPRVYSE